MIGLSRWIVVLASLLALSCATPVHEQPWIEVASPNFELSTNVDEALARKLVLDLERFRALILLAANLRDVKAGVPTRMFVFRKNWEMSPYRRSSSTTAFFLPGLRANYVAMYDSRDVDASRIIRHEYVHLLTRTSTTPQLPVWYEEGFAEYLSTVKRFGKQILIGGVPKDRVAVFRYVPWIPLRRVTAARTYADFKTVQELVMAYAESWALVHYLHLGPGGGRGLAASRHRYSDLLEAGRPNDSAFEQAFGLDLAELDEDLQEYVTSGPGVMALPLDRLGFEEPEMVTTSLPLATTAARLGQLALAAGNPEKAQELFEVALAAEPDDARAWAGLGDALKLQGEWEKAAPHFERALALDPDGALTLLDYAEWLHARALSREVWERGEGPDLLRQARRH